MLVILLSKWVGKNASTKRKYNYTTDTIKSQTSVVDLSSDSVSDDEDSITKNPEEGCANEPPLGKKCWRERLKQPKQFADVDSQSTSVSESTASTESETDSSHILFNNGGSQGSNASSNPDNFFAGTFNNPVSDSVFGGTFDATCDTAVQDPRHFNDAECNFFDMTERNILDFDMTEKKILETWFHTPEKEEN